MEENNRSTLKVTKIKDGIVIDHIDHGKSLKVLSTLGITGIEEFTVSILMNVKSKTTNSHKDVVKIEKRVLKKDELDRISLVSPYATINIIKNYEVEQKFKVEIPDRIIGIVKCSNQNCISNNKEPITAEFILESRDPIRIRCIYCDRTLTQNEVFHKI
ncbi:MAG: aspartate carbamoyltransferase regulatory subunit [Thermoplasmataceae archaeon]